MHLLSFHRRIVSAGLLLMVIDWIFENCYNCKKASQRVNPSARTERSYFRILYCTPFFVIWEGVSKKIVVPCQFCTNFCAVMP